MTGRCTLCGACDTTLDQYNECIDKSACSRREHEVEADENTDELRVISDHLGSIRDLLALISREMPDQRERLVAAGLGPMLAAGVEPSVAARTARRAADAAIGELATMSVHKLEKHKV